MESDAVVSATASVENDREAVGKFSYVGVVNLFVRADEYDLAVLAEASQNFLKS